jgi:hypothetical protein
VTGDVAHPNETVAIEYFFRSERARLGQSRVRRRCGEVRREVF